MVKDLHGEAGPHALGDAATHMIRQAVGRDDDEHRRERIAGLGRGNAIEKLGLEHEGVEVGENLQANLG